MFKRICDCGHDSDEHYGYRIGSIKIKDWDSACHAHSKDFEGRGICECNKFKQNNINYLEQKYVEQNEQ